MGVTTELIGEASITPPLNGSETSYLQEFCRIRHMRSTLSVYSVVQLDWIDPRILDSNEPPAGVPGLWCPWTTDGSTLRWDGIEKNYNNEEWLQYLIDRFLRVDALAATSGDPRFSDFTFDHVCEGQVLAIPYLEVGVFAPRVITVTNNLVVSEERVVVWHTAEDDESAVEHLEAEELFIETEAARLLKEPDATAAPLRRFLEFLGPAESREVLAAVRWLLSFGSDPARILASLADAGI